MVFVNLACGWWWSGDGNDSVDLSLHQHPVLRLLLHHDQLQPRASVSDQLSCDSNYQCSTIRISTHESTLTFWSQPDIKYHHQVKVQHKVQFCSSGDTSASLQLLVLVSENNIFISFSKNICRQHVKWSTVELRRRTWSKHWMMILRLLRQETHLLCLKLLLHESWVWSKDRSLFSQVQRSNWTVKSTFFSTDFTVLQMNLKYLSNLDSIYHVVMSLTNDTNIRRLEESEEMMEWLHRLLMNWSQKQYSWLPALKHLLMLLLLPLQSSVTLPQNWSKDDNLSLQASACITWAV